MKYHTCMKLDFEIDFETKDVSHVHIKCDPVFTSVFSQGHRKFITYFFFLIHLSKIIHGTDRIDFC